MTEPECRTSYASIGRMLSRMRIENGEELLDSDATGWTVSQLMDELSTMPPDAPVIIFDSATGIPDTLFSLHVVSEDGTVQVEISATFSGES